MGGPAVAIAVEELAHMGADTFVRVGSCGVLQPSLAVGDVIISSGVVRLGGTAAAYLPCEFPAVPTYQVLRELVDAAARMNIASHVGVTASVDAFYAPTPHEQLVKSAGVLAIEMETDTLYIVGQARGWRTGALFASDGTVGETKPEWGEEAFKRGEENCIVIALDALARITESDRAEKR
jgi:uridine phosphorylase